MKLFSIKVTVDGKKAELRGLVKNDRDVYDFEMLGFALHELSLHDMIGVEMFPGIFVVGFLSDVTEDMAKEWGFEKEVFGTAKDTFIDRVINPAVDSERIYESKFIDFNSILLILIKDE